METAHLPATPTSPTGPQMPVRVARPCGCARVAQIFVARVVAHICVDAAQVDDVVAMLEQKEVESYTTNHMTIRSQYGSRTRRRLCLC